jgi:hypothetical protein
MAIIKHGNNALSAVTLFPSAVSTGKPVLISTATASSSASIEFTSGIDSTYDIYKFEYINIHPQTDNVNFEVNFSIDGGSNYNVTKTTTFFRANHYENDSSASVSYEAGQDLAQSTSNQKLMNAFGADADQNASGDLHLFNPASTTFVKHFMAVTSGNQDDDSVRVPYIGGYCNTTSAVNAIKFVMSSGNIDAGTIKMYGISA